MLLQSYKIRLYPTKDQESLLSKSFGSNRWMWNKMLGERIDIYEKYKDDKESLYSHTYTTEKDFKDKFDWLKEVDSISLQQTRIDLIRAYKNFFRDLKKGKVSFPNFKSKCARNSYRTININNNIAVNIPRKRIKLPKLGWVKFRDNREIKSRIRSVTVSKSKSGKYFCSILHERVEKPLSFSSNFSVGIDLGISTFIVSSDGEIYDSLKPRDKLSKLHKQLSKKKKGSMNRRKARIKLSRAYEKLNNIKEDYFHKTVNSLINENQVIAIESLNVSGMLKNRKLSKAIQQASFSRFKEILKYKCDWNGRDLVEINQYFPSSKLCSNCKEKNDELTLKDRVWTCKSCETQHDRDFNASVNILNEGLKILNNTAGTAEINACKDMSSH